MQGSDWVQLINAITALIQALIWPAFILFFILRFRRQIADFLSNLSEFTLKAGPLSLEAATKAARVGALLASAESKAQGGSSTPRAAQADLVPQPETTTTPQPTTSPPASAVEERADSIASVVSQAVSPRAMRRLSRASVLWVDDRPSINVYERSALEELGIDVTISKSTADALSNVRANQYDAIISDMGRPDDSRAGYTLLAALSEMRKRGEIARVPPFIIYSGDGSRPDHQAEAKVKGAFGSTNNPSELFRLVLNAINGG